MYSQEEKSLSKRLSIVCKAICSVALAASAHASIIQNGSFEAPSLAGISWGFEVDPSATQSVWTFLNGSGIGRNGSALGYTNAPDGVQFAFLQEYGSQTASQLASFYQFLSGLDTTLTYAVTFYAEARPGHTGDPVDIWYGSQLVGIVPSSELNATWQLFSFTFTPSTSSGNLTFTSDAPSPTMDIDTGIDAVNVDVVPEPGTLFLMGSALAGIALLRRKR